MSTTLDTFKVQPGWIMAGKAVFTISNGSGTHYTYKVVKKEDKGRAPVWFVSLLSGPDNMSDYTYIGVLNMATGDVRLTRASRFNPLSTPYRVVDWSLKRLWADIPLPGGYSIDGEGRCGCCGRRLTHPDGVAGDGYRHGYGPNCWARMNGELG
jgi:hypothetical protein